MSEYLYGRQPVREALRKARFHPAWRRGKPVSSWVTVRLRFRLED